MRVAGHAAQVHQRAVEEPEDDLGEAVALRCGQLLDLLEAQAVEQVGDEHAAARDAGVHRRHVHERVPAPGPRDGAVVLRLDLVVELLADPLAQLGGERLDVHPRREPLDERKQQAEVAQVGLDGLGDARVLDLDRHRLALARDRAVHLADRGGREGLLLELGEGVGERRAELGAQQLLDLAERERRDVVAQRGERLLELLALGLRDRREVDRREHLADLHGGAAHRAELLDELARQRGRALTGGRVGALRGPHEVRGARAGPAQALAGHEAAEAARARQA